MLFNEKFHNTLNCPIQEWVTDIALFKDGSVTGTDLYSRIDHWQCPIQGWVTDIVLFKDESLALTYSRTGHWHCSIQWWVTGIALFKNCSLAVPYSKMGHKHCPIQEWVTGTALFKDGNISRNSLGNRSFKHESITLPSNHGSCICLIYKNI